MNASIQIKKHLVLPILFIGAAITLVFCAMRYPQFFFGRGRRLLSTVRFLDRGIDVSVELANEPYVWSKGLMFRDVLPDGTGMLFMFPNEQKRSFWMKNTLIPLDILFISADKKIVTIHRNAVPCTALICPQYVSTVPAMYVLEVNAGFAEQHGINEGDMVEINMQ